MHRVESSKSSNADPSGHHVARSVTRASAVPNGNHSLKTRERVSNRSVSSSSPYIYTTQQETVNNTSTIVHYGPRTTEQEKFAQTQRVLLQIQNPTNLEVAAAEWRNWLGEDARCVPDSSDHH